MRVKVVYEGAQREQLDRLIKDALTAAGLSWYASGFDHMKKERDICFDWSPLKPFPDEAVGL